MLPGSRAALARLEEADASMRRMAAVAEKTPRPTDANEDATAAHRAALEDLRAAIAIQQRAMVEVQESTADTHVALLRELSSLGLTEAAAADAAAGSSSTRAAGSLGQDATSGSTEQTPSQPTALQEVRRAGGTSTGPGPPDRSVFGSSSSRSFELRGPDVDTFGGDSHEDVEEFLRQLNLKFWQQPGTFADERSKVLYTMHRLRGTAAKWSVRIMKGTTATALPRAVQTFEQVEQLLRDAFSDPAAPDRCERRLCKLVQETTVARYCSEFMALSASLSEQWTDSKLVSQFEEGLRVDIRMSLVGRERVKTLTDMMHLAYDIEEQLLSIVSTKGATAARVDNAYRGPKCYGCQEFGHIQARCPFAAAAVKTSVPVTLVADGGIEVGGIAERKQCYGCGSTTHLKWQCPKLRGTRAADGSATDGALATTKKLAAVATAGGMQLHVPIVIRTAEGTVTENALIDTGSTGSFVDRAFAKAQGWELDNVSPTPLHLADGSAPAAGSIQQRTKEIHFAIHDTSVVTAFDVSVLGGAPILIGMDVLSKYGARISCATRTISFEPAVDMAVQAGPRAEASDGRHRDKDQADTQLVAAVVEQGRQRVVAAVTQDVTEACAASSATVQSTFVDQGPVLLAAQQDVRKRTSMQSTGTTSGVEMFEGGEKDTGCKGRDFGTVAGGLRLKGPKKRLSMGKEVD